MIEGLARTIGGDPEVRLVCETGGGLEGGPDLDPGEGLCVAVAL